MPASVVVTGGRWSCSLLIFFSNPEFWLNPDVVVVRREFLCYIYYTRCSSLIPVCKAPSSKLSVANIQAALSVSQLFGQTHYKRTTSAYVVTQTSSRCRATLGV